MPANKIERTMLIFCEECGAKAFIAHRINDDFEPVISFRCAACHYLNNITVSPASFTSDQLQVMLS